MYTYLDTYMQKDSQTKRQMDMQRDREEDTDTVDLELKKIWTYFVLFVKLKAAFKYPHI